MTEQTGNTSRSKLRTSEELTSRWGGGDGREDGDRLGVKEERTYKQVPHIWGSISFLPSRPKRVGAEARGWVGGNKGMEEGRPGGGCGNS